MGSLLRGAVCLAVLGTGWGAAALSASQPPSDAFLDAHREAIALNRPDIDFQVRFKNGQTTFNPREPIVLELVFELPPGGGLLGFMPEDPCRGWPLAQVVIDPPHGISTPQRALCQDLTERIPGGVVGGVPGGSLPGAGAPPLPKPPPVILTLTVNDWYRFDRSSAFRLYVRSAHTTGDGSHAPRQTSNVVAFTIGTRDAAYERERQMAATATLDASAATPGARRAALRELGRLASEEAAPALARFYPASREQAQEADLAIAGLLMVPNRVVAVAAMEAELQRTARGLAPGFIRDLASLEVGRRGTPYPAAQAEYLALVAHYAGVRARALDTVPGRLEAAFREDLRAGGAFEGHFYRGVLGPVAIRYPRHVTAAFGSLSSNVQRNLLTDSWRRFADPVFLPVVRRLALQSADADCALRDIAFRRWYELAPAQARLALRRERTRQRPRVSIETLSLLEDVAPPSLQRAWARLVSTAADEAVVTAAAERLERFGTRAGAHDAATAWRGRERTLSVDASAALLAYLVRVEPAVGLPALRDILGGSAADPGRQRLRQAGLLWGVGFRKWTAALEPVVIASLQHADRRVRDDAALLLRDFGSPAARASVEASLMVAIGRLTSAVPRPLWDPSADVEDSDDTLGLLASALGEARHWTITDEESATWTKRCPTSVCRAAFTHGIPALDPSRSIWVSAPTPGAERITTFRVDGVEVVGEEALLEKLRQYPRRSRFGWLERDWPVAQWERWPFDERQKLFDRVASQAAGAGIEITTQRRGP